MVRKNDKRKNDEKTKDRVLDRLRIGGMNS